MAQTGRGVSGGPGGRSPTVRRRELGARLRVLRVDAGLTVEQAAARLLVSPSKVSRLETGQRGASARDIRDLCDVYGVADPRQREYLEALAREGRRQPWWQPYDLPYATYVGLEAEALTIRDFEPSVVPGLLQTPGYARAVHERVLPPLSETVIAQRVQERQIRQSILCRDDPPDLWAVIDESVMHRAIGSPAVMAAQLERLAELSRLTNVTVQILPFSAGAHPALESTFIILDFAEPLAGVVYAEGLVGHVYLDRASDLDRYGLVFDNLRELALSPQRSDELIAATADGFRGR